MQSENNHEIEELSIVSKEYIKRLMIAKLVLQGCYLNA